MAKATTVPEQSKTPLGVMEQHTAAALGEVRKAYEELASLLTNQHASPADLLQTTRHLVAQLACAAEVVVDPLAQLMERQRELADHMAAWADLQHQLADRMAEWAELQRQLADVAAIWLAPTEGAAKISTRLLQGLADETAG